MRIQWLGPQNFQKYRFETFSSVWVGWKAFEKCQNHDFSWFSARTFSHSWLLIPKLMTHRILCSSILHERRLKFFSHILSGDGAKDETIISIAFFNFILNLTLWRERIFSFFPWGIELRGICACYQFWVQKSEMTQSLSWKSRKILSLAYFKSSPTYLSRWKCLKPTFLEVFKSEPSNPHGWNTCLKMLSDSVSEAKSMPDSNNLWIPIHYLCWKHVKQRL